MKLVDTYNNIILQEYSNKIISFLTNKFKQENPELDDNTILKYINHFDKIKLSLYPTKRDITKYSWKELKGTVLSKVKDEPKNTTVKFKDAEPIYNKNNLKIYLANSKDACVYYGNGYNFCISGRGEDDRYDEYRFLRGKEDNTIYFVFDEDLSKEMVEYENSGDGFKYPHHLLVILVPHYTYNYLGKKMPISNMDRKENIEYSVTNANNYGEDTMTWEDIVELQPKLEGLQDLFQPVDADSKEKAPKDIEKEYTEKLKNLNQLYLHFLRNTGIMGISEFTPYNKEKLYKLLDNITQLLEYTFYDENGDIIETVISTPYAPNVLDNLKSHYSLVRNRRVVRVGEKKLELNNEEKQYLSGVKELFDTYEDKVKEAIFLANQS